MAIGVRREHARGGWGALLVLSCGKVYITFFVRLVNSLLCVSTNTTAAARNKVCITLSRVDYFLTPISFPQSLLCVSIAEHYTSKRCCCSHAHEEKSGATQEQHNLEELPSWRIKICPACARRKELVRILSDDTRC
jgi:hypothetical protein